MSQQAHGHALITGALGGLGTAMTQRLLQQGCPIIACDRRDSAAGEWLNLTAESSISLRPM